MNERELSHLLADGLERIRAGQPEDEILREDPQSAEILRGLFQAARLAAVPASAAVLPPQRQSQARAAFLTAASQLRGQKQSVTAWSGWLKTFRSLPAALLVVIALAGSLLGVGFASASALPGDFLYPLKLGIESAESLFTPADRLPGWESLLEQRRYQEVEQLIALGREADVVFYGFLVQTPAGWQVGRIPLTFDASQVPPLENLKDVYVRVAGRTLPTQMVQLKDIRYKLFKIEGRLEFIDDGGWIIGDERIAFDASTLVVGVPQVSEPLRILAIRYQNGQLFALTAEALNGTGAPALTIPPADAESKNQARTRIVETLEATPQPPVIRDPWRGEENPAIRTNTPSVGVKKQKPTPTPEPVCTLEPTPSEEPTVEEPTDPPPGPTP